MVVSVLLLLLTLILPLIGESVLSLSLSESEVFFLSWKIWSFILPFIVLVLYVSTLVFSFSSYYIGGEFNFNYFLSLILTFVFSILLLLLANSIVVLILGWEGLGVSSFFLINYHSAWESSNNALVTLLTMRTGEVFLFILLVVLSLHNSIVISSHWHYAIWGFAVVFIAFTKSAQIPFSGWLPKAISAPTPTSALVHSSTLVTAGLVLTMVYSELIINSFILLLILVSGFLTMSFGSVLALVESSIKRVVAFSTLSQMGISMMVVGLGSFSSGLLSLISHGLAKSLLFIQVGYLIHSGGGQQNIRSWQMVGATEGLMRIQVLCSLLSLCGTIFFGGIGTKESVLLLMASSSLWFLLLVAEVLCIFLTIIYSVSIYKSLFSVCGGSLTMSKGSLVIIITTYSEVVLVVAHFTWISSNIIIVSAPLALSNVFIALLVIILVTVVVTFLINISVVSQTLILVLQALSTNNYYKWLVPVLVFKNFEVFLNFLNINLHLLSVMFTRKLYFGYYFNSLVLLILFVIILV